MSTLLLLGCTMVACGQAAFEVASVKPVNERDGEFFTRPTITAGRFQWKTQLGYLVGFAYDLNFTDVSGIRYFSDSPGGIYAVEAVFDPSANESRVREMVQALLAERFQMQAHMATVEVDGYALTVMPRGFKGSVADVDTPSSLEASNPRAGVTRFRGRGASMMELARTLQRVSRELVWDRTGLTGRYNFDFEYARDANADVDAPFIGTALDESLGLRLEKQKGPKQTLVIDRLEAPSEN